MRRTIALLVGAATVLVGAARPVAAAPGAPKSPAVKAAAVDNPAPGPTVPADAVDLTLSQVSGSGLAVTLDSGASEEHDIVVSNHTANLRLTIKLTATDATGKLGAAAASWLAFGDDAIQLDPHAAVTVPMTIAVPHDTQPGSALAHVSATVESAVSAADGSPVAGTASRTFPVSISVRGTATAQIAITDVHRIDQGSSHQLAVVLRNFGDQGAAVSGHVRVAGDRPQTLPFRAVLPPSRDTTVDLGWDAPPAGSASDIAVDLEYGEGNVASWSSRLGGAPTDLSAQAGVSTTTPTTTLVATDPAAVDSGSVSTPEPWWKKPWALALALVAVLGAVSWFGFEMRATRRRRGGPSPGAVHYGTAAGWAAPPNEDSVDLAKQLVRLTEVIVQLVAVHRDGWEAHGASWEVADDRARARSPGSGTPDPDRDELQPARAGPAPPDIEALVQSRYRLPESDAFPRSASPTAGDSARPDPDAAIEARFLDDGDDEAPAEHAPTVSTNLPTNLRASQPENLPTNLPAGPPTNLPTNRRHGVEARADDRAVSEDGAAAADDSNEAGAANASAALIQRLVELDRERRRLREWMDAEDSGRTIEPPVNTTGGDYRAGRAPGDSS